MFSEQFKIKVNQRKNTSSVEEWYYNIKRKDQCSFAVFDIEGVKTHSISEKLLDKAILFTKSHYNFTPDELEIALHSPILESKYMGKKAW